MSLKRKKNSKGQEYLEYECSGHLDSVLTITAEGAISIEAYIDEGYSNWYIPPADLARFLKDNYPETVKEVWDE